MTLAEKIGQMNQVDSGGGHTVDRHRHSIQSGQIQRTIPSTLVIRDSTGPCPAGGGK